MKDSLPIDSPEKEHILVVDDTPDNLRLIKAMLAPQGYHLHLVENGAKALEAIALRPPDLILVDVMMPGIDGYEVTQRIRSTPTLPFIPILLITAHDHASVVKGLALGADDFIRKPVTMEELTARVQSLLRLKHSVDERDTIARQREDFVSRLTHDLRTPLLAADRMLELMQQGVLGDLTNSMQEAIVTMIRSNRNLLTMVNTLLEVYRHDAGAKNLYFGSFDIQELLKEVIEELQPLVIGKPITLTYQPSGSAMEQSPLEIMGDRLELHRVFTNLIGNAIKFTSVGKISVTTKPTKGYLNITVQDTGVGISSEYQKQIFNRFRTGSHRAAGSGLGLYLCKKIVEAHHGNITIESTLGKGSAFTVSLPSAPDPVAIN